MCPLYDALLAISRGSRKKIVEPSISLSFAVHRMQRLPLCFRRLYAYEMAPPAGGAAIGGRFFVHIRPVRPRSRAVYAGNSTLWSVFRTHLDCLPLQQHFVVGFSYTFGPFAPTTALCGRFFVHIWTVCPHNSTLWSVFHTHLDRLPPQQRIVVGFSYTFRSVFHTHLDCLPSQQHFVVGFSYTFRSVFHTHSARLPSQQHTVVGFSYTFGPFTHPAAIRSSQPPHRIPHNELRRQ